MTPEEAPVVEIRGAFADEVVAREAADALNRWFRWILDGSPEPVPEIFEPLGVETAAYAWSLGEDVDWEIGPHARSVHDTVHVSVETWDTHRYLVGLLKGLGARTTQILRD